MAIYVGYRYTKGRTTQAVEVVARLELPKFAFSSLEVPSLESVCLTACKISTLGEKLPYIK